MINIKYYFVDKVCDDIVETAKLCDSYTLHNVQIKSSVNESMRKPSNYYPKQSSARDRNSRPRTYYCSYCKSNNHSVDFCYKKKNNYRFTNDSSNNVSHKSSFAPNMPAPSKTEKPLSATAPKFEPRKEPNCNISHNLNLTSNSICSDKHLTNLNDLKSHSSYKHFISEITCSSLTDDNFSIKCIALRDSGCSFTLLKKGVVNEKYLLPVNANVLIKGVGSEYVPCPVYQLYFKTLFGQGPVTVALTEDIPVEGVSVLLGNDILGKVTDPKMCEYIDFGKLIQFPDNSTKDPIVMFTANNDDNYNLCSIQTRAMKREAFEKLPKWSFNNDSVTVNNDMFNNSTNRTAHDKPPETSLDVNDVLDLSDTFLSHELEPFTRNKVIESQYKCDSLILPRKEAISLYESLNENNCYFYENNVLKR